MSIFLAHLVYFLAFCIVKTTKRNLNKRSRNYENSMKIANKFSRCFADFPKFLSSPSSSFPLAPTIPFLGMFWCVLCLLFMASGPQCVATIIRVRAQEQQQQQQRKPTKTMPQSNKNMRRIHSFPLTICITSAFNSDAVFRGPKRKRKNQTK